MKLWFSILLVALSSACTASDSFSDVPSNHWAAESVVAVAQAGIMRGYPDSTFGGSKYVTRYELATALANFVQYMRETEKPLIKSDADLTIEAPERWGERSVNYLKNAEFISDDSPLLKDGQALVTQDDLARTLASVAAELVALRVPAEDIDE